MNCQSLWDFLDNLITYIQLDELISRRVSTGEKMVDSFEEDTESKSCIKTSALKRI